MAEPTPITARPHRRWTALLCCLPWLIGGLAQAELPRPRERSEPPSLELLELLGEMQDENGELMDPEFLSSLAVPDESEPSRARGRNDE